MRPRRLLATILATIAIASLAAAAAQEPTDPLPDPAWLAGSTISCSAGVPSWVAGCFLERPVLVLGPLEVALGVDVQGRLDQLLAGSVDGSHVAPYGVLAYYGETSSAWLELRLPHLPGVPVLGAAEWARVGFSVRIPP